MIRPGRGVLGGQMVNTPWLSECCQAVNKLATSCQLQQAVKRKNICCPTDFLESTNTNTNVNTKKPKTENRRKFPSGCQVAVRWLSGGCHLPVQLTASERNDERRQNCLLWCALCFCALPVFCFQSARGHKLMINHSL